MLKVHTANAYRVGVVTTFFPTRILLPQTGIATLTMLKSLDLRIVGVATPD